MNSHILYFHIQFNMSNIYCIIPECGRSPLLAASTAWHEKAPLQIRSKAVTGEPLLTFILLFRHAIYRNPFSFSSVLALPPFAAAAAAD